MIALSVISAAVPVEPPPPDPRLDWWREARFGMFIHWGLYAIPAGEWEGRVYGGASEWLLNTAQIRLEDYKPLIHQFNPERYDPESWVRLAKEAGMKYIVITSKHHEGFGLWDSAYTEWDVARTPYGKDLLGPLAEAARRHGIRLCFYYSIMDWHHPDYLPRRAWDPRPEHQPDFARYVDYMKAQLRELIENYGPLGVLWFDGEWEHTWTTELGDELYDYVRSLQPDIIVNNRVSKGRRGMQGMTEGAAKGDFGTPEQEIPTSGFPGVDWESCMTFNDSWGYHAHDHNWKSARTVVEMLVDCASKGGNFLLNVGPNALGEIPAPSVERLQEVGRWLRVNGEAVYGTQAGPFLKPLPWGRVTRKDNTLYLVVFDDEASQVELSGLKTPVLKVYPIGEPKQALAVTTVAGQPTVELPAWEPTGMPRLFVAELTGVPVVERVPLRPGVDGALVLSASQANVSGRLGYEIVHNAVGFWTEAQDSLSWDIQVPHLMRYQLELTWSCQEQDAGSEVEFRAGDQSVLFQVPSTGAWSDFQTVVVGELMLGRSTDSLTIAVRAKPGGAVMNVRSVRLIPVR